MGAGGLLSAAAPRLRAGLGFVRRAVVGPDRDVYSRSVYAQVTVGALLAWIAVGGDLLGSCIYGPDTLGRAVREPASLLLIGAATILTLGLLAAAYHRLNRRFLHGGGGYTAARVLLGERLALVSGMALLLDAGVDVAISVVFAMEALASLVPPGLHWLKLPIELGIILALTAINVRGIRESVRSLAPILIFFVLTHVVTLAWAVIGRAGQVPALLASAPDGLAGMSAQFGGWKMFVYLLLGFIGSGAVYTGIECVSNAAPLLREPKARTTGRTMMLVAGVPAVMIALLLLGYVLYGVQVEGDKAMNAVLFERLADQWAAGDPVLRALFIVLPLMAEALLLVVAAQTGFSDGPRTLGALAVDRFVPRSLLRLNSRLMPERGICLVGAIAFGTTLLVGGQLAPLVAIFVTVVFVTITVSQMAMLRDALAPQSGARSFPGAVIHGAALLLSLVILAGTVATNLATVALAAPLLLGTLVAVSWRIRRRHLAIQDQLEPAGPPPEAILAGDSVASLQQVAQARSIVVLVGDNPVMTDLELEWLRQNVSQAARITFASIALVDAETIHGADHIRAAEETRCRELEELVALVRSLGFQADFEVRRAADLIAGATTLAADLTRERPLPAVVLACRLRLGRSLLDRLVEDDVAGPIAARLRNMGVGSAVLEIPMAA